MATPVIMPRQGQSVETCIITQWIKKKGDSVKEGDILFSYETDKASFDAEAQSNGILLDVFFNEGDEVPVLINVAVIGKAGEDASGFRPGNAADNNTPVAESIQLPKSESLTNEVQTEQPLPGDQRMRISPRAKVMAAKLGLNAADIKGSGPNGRIIVRDIEAVDQTPVSREVTKQTPAFSPNLTAGYDYQDIKLTNIRKLIAKSMHESISQSAQLTHHMSADVRKLLNLRNLVKNEASKGSTPNITLNDMVCFAVVRALEKFPEVNSHFLGNSIRTFKKVHLGLAVDTPRGLMVPALKNADELSLKGLSARLREIAEQCRKGEVNPDLLAASSASFTVSNLGNYGVEMFTPIINLPQVAILGVNTIIQRPADLGNGVLGFLPMMGLSLTYDHRAVDGGPATLFLKEIKNQIENFNEKL
jgi:pyruvate dehydrogenase E2 component (dihydrolipoamide acetyltransferase)